MNGRVVRAPLDGGARVRLAEGLYGPSEILADGETLYWLADGNSEMPGALVRLRRQE